MRWLFASLVLVGCAESHGATDAGTDARSHDARLDAPLPEALDAPCDATSSAELVGMAFGLDLASLDTPTVELTDCWGLVSLTVVWSRAGSIDYAQLVVDLGPLTTGGPLRDVDLEAVVYGSRAGMAAEAANGTFHVLEADPIAPPYAPLRYRGSFEGFAGTLPVSASIDLVVCHPSWCL